MDRITAAFAKLCQEHRFLSAQPLPASGTEAFKPWIAPTVRRPDFRRTPPNWCRWERIPCLAPAPMAPATGEGMAEQPGPSGRNWSRCVHGGR